MRVAAESLGAADRVHVVDTKTLSYGIGIMAMKASEMADAGASVDEIIATLESMAERVHVSFVVDTLTYLYRGGRCSGVAALAGNVLRIHPAHRCHRRRAVWRRITNTAASCTMSSMRTWMTSMPHLETADPEYVAIVYSAGLDQKILDGVRQRVEEMHRFKKIIVGQAGGVITSHCGPGTFGMGYFDAK